MVSIQLVVWQDMESFDDSFRRNAKRNPKKIMSGTVEVHHVRAPCKKEAKSTFSPRFCLSYSLPTRQKGEKVENRPNCEWTLPAVIVSEQGLQYLVKIHNFVYFER